MESPPSLPAEELPSPSTLGRIIASYVQQSSEQHELRAHKALSILKQQDVEIQNLHKKLAEMEPVKTKVCPDQGHSQIHAADEASLERKKKNAMRFDQGPGLANIRPAHKKKSSKSSHTEENVAPYPTRQIRSNVENVSEGSTLKSSSGSEGTKSQFSLQRWEMSNTHAFIQKNARCEAERRPPAGKVAEKIEYFERPGCGDVSFDAAIQPPRDGGWSPCEDDEEAEEEEEYADALPSTRGASDTGIPCLRLPPTPGTESEGAGGAGGVDGVGGVGGIGGDGAGKCRQRVDAVHLGTPLCLDAARVPADDYMKHFLDVKLMEASLICQGMKRDAPRPAVDTGKAAGPETAVLYPILKPRKSAAKCSSSESVESRRSSRSRSRESPTEAHPAPSGAPRDPSPHPAPPRLEPPELQHRRLIDHLVLYNRELKAELSKMETRAALDTKFHLAEVSKLQEYVSEMKESISVDLPTSFPGSLSSADSQRPRKKVTFSAQNVSSQTDTLCEGDMGARGTPTTEQPPEMPARGCCCCALGDSEVPPQWLLAEALARAKQADTGHGVALDIIEEESQLETFELGAKIEVRDASSATEPIVTSVASTQVDLSDSKAKINKIEAQENTIAELQRKVEELQHEIVNLGEKSRRQRDKERQDHRRVQTETQEKMINFCSIVTGGRKIPRELFTSTTDERSFASSSRNSSDESQRLLSRKLGRPLAKLKSRWDILAARRYVKSLKRKLRLLKSSNGRFKMRIADLERCSELKEQTQKAMEKCVNELLAEAIQLRARCQHAEQAIRTPNHGHHHDNDRDHDHNNDHNHDVGTGDANDFVGVDKSGKQAVNASTQNLQTRLRNAHQQLMVRSKALSNLQQELKETQNSLQNAKNRLTRSEALHQNKQLIIDNYKRRMEEIGSKEALTMNRISVAKHENNLLKFNNSKKQSANCRWIPAERETVAVKVSSDSLISEEDIATTMDVVRLNNQFEQANLKFKKSEHKLAEFQAMLQYPLTQRFLRLARAHFKTMHRDLTSASAPRTEARALACSILNLTHGQLDGMLFGSGAAGSDAADTQLMKWLDECKSLYSSETFSEKLACYLLDVLNEMTSSNLV